MNQAEETNQSVLAEAVKRLMTVVSWDNIRQMMMEAATITEAGTYMIGIKELRYIIEGYDAAFPVNLLLNSKDKHVIRKVDLQMIFDAFDNVFGNDTPNMSNLDTLKLTMIDDDNDLQSYSYMLQQFIQDPEFEDIKQGFADSIVKCIDEDLSRLIGDVVSLGVERDRLDYVPLTIKFIRYFAEYGREQETFLERFLVCNGYVDADALHELLIQFDEVTPTELLDNLVRYDIYGSAVFGLNRIAKHIYPKIGKEVLQKYLEVATESGKQEIAMVIRDMVRNKMIADPQSSAPVEDLSSVRKQESRLLQEYSDLLANMDDDKRPVDREELERHLGTYLDVSGITIADVDMRNVRALQVWSFIENSEVFRALYGPVHPPNYLVEAEDMEIDVPYDPRLFHMRFNDIAYRLSQEDGTVDEELLDDPFLSFNRDWFTGFCQYSNDVILHREKAFRRPRMRGGWSGCYGSADSILLEILQGYDVPVAKRRHVLDNIQEQFIRFFREELGLQDNKLGYAFMTKNRVILQSEDKIVQTQEDINSPIKRLPKIVIKYAVEHDEPGYKEDADMEAFAQRILDGIMTPGDDAMALARDGGPARKFEKEIILKREDIIVFALTKIYFAY